MIYNMGVVEVYVSRGSWMFELRDSIIRFKVLYSNAANHMDYMACSRTLIH